MAQLFGQIDSVEIWDDYILDSLFDQISFLESVDGFKDKNTVGELIDDIMGLLQYVENLCDEKVKSGGGSFGFYRKPSRISPGYMLTETSVGKYFNLKVASINSLSFLDQKLAQEMNRNFGTALDMSPALAMGAKRERRIYFKKLQTRIGVWRAKKTKKVIP